jgi:hypothetical protein
VTILRAGWSRLETRHEQWAFLQNVQTGFRNQYAPGTSPRVKRKGREVCNLSPSSGATILHPIHAFLTWVRTNLRILKLHGGFQTKWQARVWAEELDKCHSYRMKLVVFCILPVSTNEDMYSTYKTCNKRFLRPTEVLRGFQTYRFGSGFINATRIQ